MRAIKPVFFLALILTLTAGCGAPGGNPAALPASTQPAATDTPTVAATATEILPTPTATEIPPTPTEIDPTPTVTEATPVSIPVTASGQVEVVNDTLCYGGPGRLYGVMSSLYKGSSVNLLGVGAREGWFIVLNPTYKLPCWIAEADLKLDPSFNTSTLKVYGVPVIPADLVPSKASLNPSPPACNQAFTIYVKITNTGLGSTLIGGSISATDLRSSDDSVVTTASGSFPTLNPGQIYMAHFNMTVKKYPGEEHQLLITIDSNNQIVETNKNDNTVTIKYTLDQGSCT